MGVSKDIPWKEAEFFLQRRAGRKNEHTLGVGALRRSEIGGERKNETMRWLWDSPCLSVQRR